MFTDWYNYHKKAISAWCVSSVLTATIFFVSVAVINANSIALFVYLQSGEVVSGFNQVALSLILSIISTLTWTLLSIYLFLKILFPNATAVKDAFAISEIHSLVTMPKKVLEGIKKG